MTITQQSLPELLRRIGTTEKDLWAIKCHVLLSVQRTRLLLAERVAPPGWSRNEKRVYYKLLWRRQNILNGLRYDGKPRRYQWVNRNGLSKDHRAYMRFWRKWKEP